MLYMEWMECEDFVPRIEISEALSGVSMASSGLINVPAGPHCNLSRMVLVSTLEIGFLSLSTWTDLDVT